MPLGRREGNLGSVTRSYSILDFLCEVKGKALLFTVHVYI